MSFSDRIRRIWLEDQATDVPENATSNEIIRRSGQNPSNRTLVKSNSDGTTTFYNSSDRPKLKDGDRFETQVNVWGGSTQNWYEQNFEIIRRTLRTQVTHGRNYKWIRIEKFPLPPVYNKPSTKLLIRLPGLSGIENKSKYHFYLTKNLSRTDGIKMEHYFQNELYNDLLRKGYSRLSFHLRSFSPRLNAIEGDNLVDVIQAVYNFLAQKRGV